MWVLFYHQLHNATILFDFSVMAERESVKNKKRRQKHKPANFEFSNDKPESLTIQTFIFFIEWITIAHINYFFPINHLKHEQRVNIPMTWRLFSLDAHAPVLGRASGCCLLVGWRTEWSLWWKGQRRPAASRWISLGRWGGGQDGLHPSLFCLGQHQSLQQFYQKIQQAFMSNAGIHAVLPFRIIVRSKTYRLNII